MGGDVEEISGSDVTEMFQSTPPRGGRRIGAGIATIGRMGFNPRPRVGGDRKLGFRRGGGSRFQSTPPRGGRPVEVRILIKLSVFQSTPPRGGRPIKHRFPAGIPGFNPRPRVGGDCAAFACHAQCRVSIHAPAWGATFGWGQQQAQRFVSIHAPAWGATGCYPECL